MKSLLLLLTLVSPFYNSFAQDTTIIYYNKYWNEISDKENALYYRTEIRIEDNIHVTDHFMNGDIQMVGTFLNDTEPKSRNSEFIWYFENGQTKTQVTYIKGKRDGKYMAWYETGEVRETCYFNLGELDGESKVFYENGTLKTHEFYKRGENIDTYRYWHENESLATLIKYDCYKGKDSIYYWHENGVKKMEAIYYSSDASSLRIGNYWDENGNQAVTNGTGTYTTYTDEYCWTGPILNGLYSKKWKKYKVDKDGNILENRSYGVAKYNQGTFINGSITYDEKNKLKIKSSSTDAVFVGGFRALNLHITNKLNSGNCDEDFIQNKVIIQFIINRDGSISDVIIIEGETTECQEENIYDIFNSMPNWIPASKHGRLVRTRYNFPMEFSIE